MEKERLLIYGHYYYPDPASTGQLLKDLAEGLAQDYAVTLICTVPSYTGVIDDAYKTKGFYKETINGVDLIRVRVPEFNKADKKSRVFNILSYFLGAVFASFKLPKQDYVLAVSQPPILGGMLGVIGKWLKRGKLIYLIQDFNPEQTKAVNYSTNSFLLNVAMKLDTFSCKQANRVVVVGRDMVDTLYKRFKKKSYPEVRFINNWTDEEAIYPLPDTHPNVAAFKKTHDLENKVIVQYSGNLGLYYDLENLMTVIEQFKGHSNLVFLFIGEGSIKDNLLNIKEKLNLSNVMFLPYQDKDELVYSLNAGDIHWVVNAKGIKGISVPSKLYGIMAAGKPVIGVLEEGSEARRLIEESKCGLVADPGDYEAIKELIEISLANKEERQLAGEKGRRYLEQALTKNISLGKYKELLAELYEEPRELKKQVIRS